MKKTFPLESSGHAPARVVESIKNDIRKYLSRERRKSLPEGVDFWDFDCRIGSDADSAAAVHVKEIHRGIEGVAAGGGRHVYVEIFAKPGYRSTRSTGQSGGAEAGAPEDGFHG
jgi:hypothetical protein